MADTTAIPRCAYCTKTSTEPSINLKRCGKCQATKYCSRECQRADWATHKKACSSIAASGNTAGSTSATPLNNGDSSAASAAAGNCSKGLSVQIDKPFHRLNDRKWLHDRPERDIYTLLVDTYRFRMEDDYKLEGNAGADSMYSGARDGRQGFRRFLRLAEGQSGLLPPWWSRKKAENCEAVGMHDGWSSLACVIRKDDVIEYYGDRMMPMQLRMFGEQVYGRGPGGQSGAEMRQFQMKIESEALYWSHLDVSSTFHRN